jgi:chromosome segregation ATPase
VRGEIQQDKRWVIRLRTLPDAPETFYLMQLMASHDFQTALQNYLDLEELRAKTEGWHKSLDAFEDMIRLRRRNYEPLLPEIDAQFRELDAQIRLRKQQRDHLQQRLQRLLIEPRPDLLATADERIVLETIRAIERALHDATGPEVPQLEQRLRRVKGMMTWSLHSNYAERLTEAHAHLKALNADIAVMNERYQEFVRARQAAVHSYMGYEDTIARLRRQSREALQTINQLMSRQGHLIETVAVSELKARQDRLVAYQTQARYAVADSYDRATKTQGLKPEANGVSQ